MQVRACAAVLARNLRALGIARDVFQQRVWLRVFEFSSLGCCPRQIRDARADVRVLKLWLWKREGGAGTLCDNVSIVPRHYDVARIHRGFFLRHSERGYNFYVVETATA